MTSDVYTYSVHYDIMLWILWRRTINRNIYLIGKVKIKCQYFVCTLLLTEARYIWDEGQHTWCVLLQVWNERKIPENFFCLV